MNILEVHVGLVSSLLEQHVVSGVGETPANFQTAKFPAAMTRETISKNVLEKRYSHNFECFFCLGFLCLQIIGMALLRGKCFVLKQVLGI
jgi:hypothetical protein